MTRAQHDFDASCHPQALSEMNPGTFHPLGTLTFARISHPGQLKLRRSGDQRRVQDFPDRPNMVGQTCGHRGCAHTVVGVKNPIRCHFLGQATR